MAIVIVSKRTFDELNNVYAENRVLFDIKHRHQRYPLTFLNYRKRMSLTDV